MVGDAGRFGLFLYLLNDLFGITPLSLKASLLLVVFVVATEPVLRYLTKLLKLLQRFWSGSAESGRPIFTRVKKACVIFVFEVVTDGYSNKRGESRRCIRYLRIK